MNIFITHFFTKNNKGDAGILFTMIDQIKKVFGEVEITVATTEPINEDKQDYKLVHSFFYHAIYTRKNKFMKAFKSLWIILVSTLWAICYRLFGIKMNFLLNAEVVELMNTYIHSDLVVPAGGGYITGKDSLSGNVTVLLHVHAIMIARILDKPVFLFSQSIGPFGNRFQKYIASKILNLVQAIFIRENFSAETLRDINVNPDLIYKTVDTAFAFENGLRDQMHAELERLGVTFKRPVVGITVKNWLNAQMQSEYESSVAKFIDFLIKEKQMDVVMVSQVTSSLHHDDDRLVGHRIEKIIKQSDHLFVLNQEYSAHQIKSIYHSLDYLIGTRMHSCIFSLTSYKPVIAIEYEYKTRGIMRDLKLEEWVIKIEDVTSEILISKFELLLSENHKYLNILRNNLPRYQNEVENSFFVLKDKYLALKHG